MNHCIDCGKEISKQGKRCQSCATKEMWDRWSYRRKMSKIISTRMIGNTFTRGKILTDDHKLKIARSEAGKVVSRETRKKQSKRALEHLQLSFQNGRGVSCFSDDGVLHASLQERDCYDWVRKELKLKIRKFGRFDFIINDSVVLEYHPCNWYMEPRGRKQYYKDRRSLLDNMGHKDLKLVVTTGLDNKEKGRTEKLLWL